MLEQAKLGSLRSSSSSSVRPPGWEQCSATKRPDTLTPSRTQARGRHPHVHGERDVPPAYPGGAGDSGLVSGGTPNRDVVGSHSLLMMSGHCSPSFTAHVRWYGHAPSRAPAVVRTVLRVMSLHAMNLHARYTALARGQQLRPEDRRRAPQRRRPPAWGGRRPAAPVPPRPPPPPRARQAPVVRKRSKTPVVHPAKRPTWRLSHSAKRCEGCKGFSCACGRLSGVRVVAPPPPPYMYVLSLRTV